MNLVHLILMILALVCFLFAALDIFPPRRGNATAAGLLLWALATLIGGLK